MSVFVEISNRTMIGEEVSEASSRWEGQTSKRQANSYRTSIWLIGVVFFVKRDCC